MRIICGVSRSPPLAGDLARRSGKEDVVHESADELWQRNRVLEARISYLSAALLRPGASLDLETVLRQIVDSARALNRACYGLIRRSTTAGSLRTGSPPAGRPACTR